MVRSIHRESDKRIVVDLRSFPVPTEEAMHRFLQCQQECWANTPANELDGRTPWEAALTPKGRREVEEFLSDSSIGSSPVGNGYIGQLESPRDPDTRFIEAYKKSGGLLNVFNERATEADDDQWHSLVRQSIKDAGLTNGVDEHHVRKETERTWNATPSELFSSLTPGQVWAGGGPDELELSRDLMFRLKEEEFGDNGRFDSRGDMIRSFLMFLRKWQVIPQREFGWKRAVNIIHEERTQILCAKMDLLLRLQTGSAAEEVAVMTMQAHTPARR
jgi:hypothetical protein